MNQIGKDVTIPITQQSPQGENNALQKLLAILAHCLLDDSGQRFMPLAQYLMNELTLVVSSGNGETAYRVVECEVYYFDEGKNHPDPYTHNRYEQASFGNWYFNDFGLDITIGNVPESGKKVFGGILLRSLYNISKNTYKHGPSGVVRELFSQMGSVFNQKASLYFREVRVPYQDTSVYSTKRVNLPKKEEDYYNRPYRFVCHVTPANKIPGKEALVRRLLEAGPLSEEETRQIESMLDYKLKM